MRKRTPPLWGRVEDEKEQGSLRDKKGRISYFGYWIRNKKNTDHGTVKDLETTIASVQDRGDSATMKRKARDSILPRLQGSVAELPAESARRERLVVGTLRWQSASLKRHT